MLLPWLASQSGLLDDMFLLVPAHFGMRQNAVGTRRLLQHQAACEMLLRGQR